MISAACFHSEEQEGLMSVVLLLSYRFSLCSSFSEGKTDSAVTWLRDSGTPTSGASESGWFVACWSVFPGVLATPMWSHQGQNWAHW